jgi:hypothetical protein
MTTLDDWPRAFRESGFEVAISTGTSPIFYIF